MLLLLVSWFMILFGSVPAIIGAVVGGVASLLAFFLALLCYGRRIRRGKQRVDVIPDEDDGFYDRPGSSPFLQLQPYLIHTPSTFSISDHGRLSTSATNNSRQSSELAHLIPASPPASATSWRSGSGSGTPRPIDLILHDDAGPPSAPEELPPAYANLQNSGPYPQAAQVTSTKRWI